MDIDTLERLAILVDKTSRTLLCFPVVAFLFWGERAFSATNGLEWSLQKSDGQTGAQKNDGYIIDLTILDKKQVWSKQVWGHR